VRKQWFTLVEGELGFSGFLILWVLWNSYPLPWRTCLLIETGCSDFAYTYQL